MSILKRITVGVAALSLLVVAACSGTTANGVTPSSSQLINGAAAVAQVADIIATDVPLILHGGSSTTITEAAQAVSAAATSIASSGLNLTSAQSIVTAVNALISAAESDPQVASNSKVMGDLQLAQLTIGGVVAIWDVVSPILPATTPAASH